MRGTDERRRAVPRREGPLWGQRSTRSGEAWGFVMSAQGMTIEQVNDFAALEDRLVDLLKAAFAGRSPAVHVLTSADLEGVKETMQTAPAIHVVSNGFAPVESQYGAARLQHTWYVVAVAKSAATQRSGHAARREAGALLAQAMAALLSQRLPGAAEPLELARAPRGVYRAGFYYQPSAWTVESVFRKPN